MMSAVRALARRALRRRGPWPEPAAWIRERLPRVVDDPALHAAIDEILALCDALPIDEGDRVFVHGDVGFHNLAVDPETLAVQGIFDYDGAAWADRHHDFRSLLFAEARAEMLEGALVVYEAAVGLRLSRHRIALYNAVCAASFLAYRDGVSAEARWCGRTLADDLRWTGHALARLAASRP